MAGPTRDKTGGCVCVCVRVAVTRVFAGAPRVVMVVVVVVVAGGQRYLCLKIGGGGDLWNILSGKGLLRGGHVLEGV